MAELACLLHNHSWPLPCAVTRPCRQICHQHLSSFSQPDIWNAKFKWVWSPFQADWDHSWCKTSFYMLTLWWQIVCTSEINPTIVKWFCALTQPLCLRLGSLPIVTSLSGYKPLPSADENERRLNSLWPVWELCIYVDRNKGIVKSNQLSVFQAPWHIGKPIPAVTVGGRRYCDGIWMPGIATSCAPACTFYLMGPF